jgi:hypothetical protein
MNSRTLYLLLVSASLHASANAQLFKCKGADGRTVFQDVSCAAGATDVNQRPKPPAREEAVVLPPKDSKPGANWDTGPRAPLPSRPAAPPPTAGAPKQASPARSPQVAREPRQGKPQGDLAAQQANEQWKAENEKVAAHNRMVRCNFARQQLDVATRGRPIFSRDDKGNRHYVEEENRKATITAAEKRVTEDCK